MKTAPDAERKFSSTQVQLPEELAQLVRDHAASIPDAALAEDGRENDPHVTVKWGLHDQDHSKVARLVKGSGSVAAKLGKASVFRASKANPDYDVVKIDVESPDLHKLNKRISMLPHTDTHPGYKPHITLAYVKPGLGDKFAGPIDGLTGHALVFHSLRFSPKGGDPTEIPLGTKKPLPSGTGVRRVTGSADIDLNAIGRAQAKEMTGKLTRPFDAVFCGPESRMIETAKYFGDPIVLKGLDAWKRGAYEGKPADSLKGMMRLLMANPDKQPPGKSDFSGESGQSHNEFIKPLLTAFQTILKHTKKGERTLTVTSGGGLQVIDAYLKAGTPADIAKFSREEMSKQAYWTATGVLFRAEPHGLKKVTDDDQEGDYFMEHCKTDFNQGPCDTKVRV